MKQKWFYIIIVLGVVVMLSAAAVFSWQAYTEHKAEADINDLLSKAQTLLQQDPDQKTPLANETDGPAVAGILSAPRLGKELPVLTKANLEEISAAPGIYKGELPPSEGVLVLYGHAYKSHFAFLSELAAGDELCLTTMDGTDYVYQVKEVKVIEPEDVSAVEKSYGDQTLNLFTCTKDGQKRVFVGCALVEQEAAS